MARKTNASPIAGPRRARRATASRPTSRRTASAGERLARRRGVARGRGRAVRVGRRTGGGRRDGRQRRHRDRRRHRRHRPGIDLRRERPRHGKRRLAMRARRLAPRRRLRHFHGRQTVRTNLADHTRPPGPNRQSTTPRPSFVGSAPQTGRRDSPARDRAGGQPPLRGPTALRRNPLADAPLTLGGQLRAHTPCWPPRIESQTTERPAANDPALSRNPKVAATSVDQHRGSLFYPLVPNSVGNALPRNSVSRPGREHTIKPVGTVVRSNARSWPREATGVSCRGESAKRSFADVRFPNGVWERVCWDRG